jgi:hypothetical protein
MLFDWLVSRGQLMGANPAHAASGPKYVVRKGKTPALSAEEAHELLNSNPLVRNTAAMQGPGGIPKSSVVGLRDRALIGRHGLQLRASTPCSR